MKKRKKERKKEVAFRSKEPAGVVWFRNETFGATLRDGTNIDPFSVRRYDDVSMNNPFSGYCIGVHVRVQQSKIPGDNFEADHTWVTIGSPMNGYILVMGVMNLWMDVAGLQFWMKIATWSASSTPSGFAVGVSASTLESGEL